MRRPCKRGDRARVLEPDDLASKGQVRSVWSPIETDSRGIERRFEAGDEVTLEALKAKGLGSRRDVPVKVLAKGTLSKKLTVHAHKFSGAAREAIEAAGGTAVLIDG